MDYVAGTSTMIPASRSRATSRKIMRRPRTPDRSAEEVRFVQVLSRSPVLYWGENVSVVVNAEAKNGVNDLDKTYRFNKEERTFFVPSGGEIDEKLNAALENVLNQIVSDMQLMAFLAQ